jgi:hypothetical protein
MFCPYMAAVEPTRSWVLREWKVGCVDSNLEHAGHPKHSTQPQVMLSYFRYNKEMGINTYKFDGNNTRKLPEAPSSTNQQRCRLSTANIQRAFLFSGTYSPPLAIYK